MSLIDEYCIIYSSEDYDDMMQQAKDYLEQNPQNEGKLFVTECINTL